LAKIKSIAIDGPVASGKSSVGLTLANRLGYLFLDTGVMYRAVTWAAIQAGLDVNDEASISKLVSDLKLEIKEPSKDDGRINDVLINGVDVTWEIKNEDVNNNVSRISTYARVRQILTEKQRQFGKKGKIVMVGRDIGTVVLPDADLKIFLVASIEERAKRRYEEEKVRNSHANYADILENMKMRDKIDSSRELAPLVKAEDAVTVDTNGKTKDEVVEKILEYVE